MRHITRSLDTIMTVSIMPIALMLLFVYVFGGAINAGPDRYVNYLLPGILLITIAMGISYTALLVFILPMYMYLFVVALGTDYNILMISRLREEARAGKPPREAAALALAHAGPAIGAAGLILAGTFASLTLAGEQVLTQVGFAVAAGIAIAAFVMAMFFSPSLTALIGRRAWWPGHADRATGRSGALARRGAVVSGSGAVLGLWVIFGAGGLGGVEDAAPGLVLCPQMPRPAAASGAVAPWIFPGGLSRAAGLSRTGIRGAPSARRA
jgi:uncharacterized membrane protein YdfJ with MMPL/SSD domain